MNLNHLIKLHWKPYLFGLVSASIVFLLVGRSPLRGDRFEFHPLTPLGMWRCNKVTGEVDYKRNWQSTNGWERVPEAAKK